ncbi:hypothetical protein TRIP_B310004 [uncultured Desulfatiglans sp.]|nr:hypothetical protein TRIP_B310004 [uncultured Desulfatiglans sp.]
MDKASGRGGCVSDEADYKSMARRILLGEISSYKAAVIAKYLKLFYPRTHITAYDYKGIIRCFHTKYCDDFISPPSPKEGWEVHLRFLRDIIKERQIDLFVPVHSEMYGEYIKHRDFLGRAFGYLGDFAQFDLLHDKRKLNGLLAELDIRRPRTYTTIDVAELPCVVKPRNLSSSKGVKYILSEEDRNKCRSLNGEDLIIQEYVDGVGCGYSVYAQDGQVLIGFGHKRLAEQPVTGGSSVYRDTYFNCRIREISEEILKATKWTGFAMLEFKLTDKGEIYVIEINPRIWGSINQGLQNGCNYFEPLLGKSNFVRKKDVQYKTYLSPLLYISLLNYLFRLDVGPLANFFKNIRVNRADVSFLDDPKGFISLIARKM